MHPETTELISANTNHLTALLFQHPVLSVDLELRQDLNFYTISANRCLKNPTAGLFDHADSHHRLQYLDRVFCHLLVQPTCSLLESQSQRPLHERVEAVVYKRGTQYCHRFRALDPSDADHIQAPPTQEAEDRIGMYHVARWLVSIETSKLSGRHC